MKKFISIMLAVVMTMSMAVSAFASDRVMVQGAAEIIEDNDRVRVAQVIDGNDIYRATFDKQKNTVTTERLLDDGTLLASAKVDLNTKMITVTNPTAGTMTTETVISKTTESKYAYEYTNTNPREWKLVRPKYAEETNEGGYYFRTKQNSTNRDDLDDFRTTVNSIASAESELKQSIGASSFLAGFAVGFAVGTGGSGFGIALSAYIASLGYSLAAQAKANEIGELQDDAYSTYYDVFYESTVSF